MTWLEILQQALIDIVGTGLAYVLSQILRSLFERIKKGYDLVSTAFSTAYEIDPTQTALVITGRFCLVLQHMMNENDETTDTPEET